MDGLMETRKATFLLWVQSNFWKIIYKEYISKNCHITDRWYGLTPYSTEFLFFFSLLHKQCTLKLSFTWIRIKKWVRPTAFLSSVPFLVRQLPGYLAGDWWVESWSLSYILAHWFSVRDESHRLSRSFILGGIPKDTSIRFQREPSQSYLFTAFSTSLQSQTRASLLSSLCPTLCFTFTGQSIKSSILSSI